MLCTIRSLWRFALCNHFLCQESEKDCEKTVNKLFRHWNLTLWNPYSVAQCDTAGAHLSGDWSLFALSAQNIYISIVWCGCAPKHMMQLWVCSSMPTLPPICTATAFSPLHHFFSIRENKGFRSFKTVWKPFHYIFFQKLYKTWLLNNHNACKKITEYYNNLFNRPNVFPLVS